jgi:hypothetical protein
MLVGKTKLPAYVQWLMAMHVGQAYLFLLDLVRAGYFQVGSGHHWIGEWVGLGVENRVQVYEMDPVSAIVHISVVGPV